MQYYNPNKIEIFFILFIIFVSGTLTTSARTPSDDNPGILMLFCGNNPVSQKFNVEGITAGNIINGCTEILDGYSWGSRIYVLIFAPAWNTDPYKLDIIGNSRDNPITVTSREGRASLEGEGCNGFIETGFDHGLFFGSIKLSGFRHDITGDGVPDLFGGNRCERNISILDDGSGRVEAKQKGSMTVTWQYAEDKFLSKTAEYTWREATLEFDKEIYSVTDEVNLMLNDLDNLRFPFDDDKKYEITVYSDTDGRGIILDAYWKTDYKGIPQRTGTYPVEFYLTTDEESRDGSRLRISPGDTIYAQYTDYSLPPPYSINDSVDVIVTAKVASVFDKPEILLAKSIITDIYGKQIETAQIGDILQIMTELGNPNDEYFTVSQLVQIKNAEGHIEKIFLATNNLPPKHSTQSFQSWTPKHSGMYTIEVFVWDGLTYAIPLAKSQTLKVIVN